MTLKTDMTTDLDDIFFLNDEFSEDLTLTPAGMAARTIKGIFDEPFEAVSPATGEVETTAPAVIVMTSDVSGVVNHGDIITRPGGTRYEIIGIRPDGTGVTELLLSRDEA